MIEHLAGVVIVAEAVVEAVVEIVAQDEAVTEIGVAEMKDGASEVKTHNNV